MPQRIPGTARATIRKQARRIADLEQKIRNRDQEIADLDKHRHDLYQERDDLLHRIDVLEACRGTYRDPRPTPSSSEEGSEMDPISEDIRRQLERFIEDDLSSATVTSATINVDEHGRITVEEIILRRQDRKEVSLGLAGMRPDGTRREPAIVIDIYDAPKARRPWTIGGWREMTIPEDYAEDLAELTADPYHPGPPEPWDRE